MLIILGGLPASGKSTIAQALAVRIGACYLRVDTVEQAIRSATPPSAVDDVGPAGYVTLYRLAADNLRLGHTVIVDSVNAIEITRQAFRDVARKTGSRWLQVEVVCSDAAMHRLRAETRRSTVEGWTPPNWEQIRKRRFEPWKPDLRVDTSLLRWTKASRRS
ncbi:AAA family ATPase [Ochrobactrum sp. AP1BH01-1]|nr:AAA family ATPase [Ochrobactrum sp. AP1BH01-1]MBQ0711135.1 AAA family ATPase [Ochrobactrum sp. AP1BH01-1]